MPKRSKADKPQSLKAGSRLPPSWDILRRSCSVGHPKACPCTEKAAT